MKRYYITRVIGTGIIGDSYRSELRRYIQDNWPAEPHFIKQAIHPNVLMWCIMKYDLSDPAHTDVMANLTGIYSFPAGALDRELGTLDATVRLDMRTKLENVGFNFDWATGTNTIRDVLKYVFWSTQLASWADVEISAVTNFDIDSEVRDIPPAKRQNINTHLEDLGIPVNWITGTTTIREIVNRVQFLDDGTTPRMFGRKKRQQWFYVDEDIE